MKRPCMTIEEDVAWHAADAIAQRRTGSPCADCTVAFHLEMLAVGQCNGEPGGIGRPVRVADDPRRERRRAQWRDSQRRRTVQRGTMNASDPGRTSGRDGGLGPQTQVSPAA